MLCSIFRYSTIYLLPRPLFGSTNGLASSPTDMCRFQQHVPVLL